MIEDRIHQVNDDLKWKIELTGLMFDLIIDKVDKEIVANKVLDIIEDVDDNY